MTTAHQQVAFAVHLGEFWAKCQKSVCNQHCNAFICWRLSGSDALINNPGVQGIFVTDTQQRGFSCLLRPHARLKANPYVSFCENHGNYIFAGVCRRTIQKRSAGSIRQPQRDQLGCCPRHFVTYYTAMACPQDSMTAITWWKKAAAQGGRVGRVGATVDQ